MERMENYTMSPAKRPAESTESAPIGLEKRIKISGDQEDTDELVVGEQNDDVIDEEVIDVSDGEMSYYIRRRGPNYRSPGSPETCDPPSECCFCHEVTNHMPSYCPKYPPSSPSPPPPTSEDVKNNRVYYCSLCAKYVDHDNKLECPLRNILPGYRITENGRVQYCRFCRKDIHPGKDCPDSPPLSLADDIEDDDFGIW